MEYLMAIGFGVFWQGALILWVGGFPLMLVGRSGPKPEKGTREAFSYFWLEQYRFIGLTLAIIGAVLVVLGSGLVSGLASGMAPGAAS